MMTKPPHGLERYVEAFSRLRSDKAPARWPAGTLHRAPHKPLLLLAVIDLFQQGLIARNLIEPSEDLAHAFGLYWSRVMGPGPPASFVLPFYHLKSDGFWHLKAMPGKEAILAAVSRIQNASQLRDLVLGASLDEELFGLLSTPAQRQVLAETLIERYFEPAIRAQLREQEATNREAMAYSKELLAHDTSRAQALPAEARRQGFRRAVITAYARRCAFCGIRLITADGRTAVDAAHIVPWSVSRNDDPRNGLSLCKLCHWTFDEGLLAVNSKFILIASPHLRSQHCIPAHIAAIADRPIFEPADSSYAPDIAALDWHRRHTFLKA